jgi:hypothetical protein
MYNDGDLYLTYGCCGLSELGPTIGYTSEPIRDRDQCSYEAGFYWLYGGEVNYDADGGNGYGFAAGQGYGGYAGPSCVTRVAGGSW